MDTETAKRGSKRVRKCHTVDALNRTAHTLYIDATRVTNTWDSAGQQLTMQDVTGVTGYVYDLDGRQIAVQNPTGISLTSTLDSLGGPSEVVLGQGRSRQMRYIWGGLASQNRSGTSSFYLYDSQGSVRNLVNPAGAITDTYLYTAFGVELLTSGSTINPFRYVGLYGYYHVFVDIYYIRARWLDAIKGRWDSRDPIGPAIPNSNLYVQSHNEPVLLVDPSGEYPSVGNCTGGTVNAINLACNCISNPGPSDWAAVGTSIAYVSRQLSLPCASSWSANKSPTCYSHFCTFGPAISGTWCERTALRNDFDMGRALLV